MTLPGHHPLDEQVLKQVARLVQLHHDTHPERIARRFNLSVSYVRQCWRERHMNEMAELADALQALHNILQRVKEPR